MFRPDGERPVVARQRLVRTLQPPQGNAAIAPCRSEIRLDRQSLVVARYRLIQTTCLMERIAAPVEELRLRIGAVEFLEFTNEVQHLAAGGVAMGQSYAQLSLEDRCEIARLQAAGLLDPANRGSSGSRAIDDCSRAEAQQRRDGRLPTGLRPRTGKGAALVWLAARARPRPAPTPSSTGLKTGLVARAGRRPPRARRRAVRSSATRASIASSTPRSPAPTTTAGASICRAARANAASAAASGGSPASFIESRVPIAQRPTAAADRQTPGHWEADLMLFAKYGQAILAIHDRHTRLIVATPTAQQDRRPHRRAAPRLLHAIAAGLCARPSPSTMAPSSPVIIGCTTSPSRPSSAIPTPPGRRAASRTPSADCAASSPERPISLPSPTNASTPSCAAYNHTPRKCLDYQTPAEVFLSQLAARCGCRASAPSSRPDRSSSPRRR